MRESASYWPELLLGLFAFGVLTIVFVAICFFNLIMPFLISPEAYEAGERRAARRHRRLSSGSSWGGSCGSSCGGGGGCGGGD